MNAVGVSAGEQSLGPTARRMILGSQLRRLREEAGITRQQAGYNIRGSESKISRLELGRVGFKERDVADLLTMYGVSDEDERKAFLDMVKQSNEAGWWRKFGETVPGWFTDLVGCSCRACCRSSPTRERSSATAARKWQTNVSTSW